MSRQVVNFIIYTNGFVLMEWRNEHPFFGALNFPGGKMEPGEDYSDTLVREAREELGIKILDATPIETVYSGTWTLHPYLVTRYEGLLPKVTDAGDELFWLHLADACEVSWAPAAQMARQVRDLLAQGDSVTADAVQSV